MPDGFSILIACQPLLPQGPRPQPVEHLPELPPEEKHISPDVCSSFDHTLIDQGFPLPGSKSFCEAVALITNGFEKVAQVVFDWLADLNPLDRLLEALKLPIGEGVLLAGY